MTQIAQTRMNVVLALVPAAGLVYLTYGVALSPIRVTAGAMVALGVLWLTTTVAFKTIWRPLWEVMGRRQEVAARIAPRLVMTPAFPMYVVDVSRPATRWNLRSVLLAPVELLALAWGFPVLMLLVMLPISLAFASALWVGRFILQL
jgi:hypothetical protein